MGTLKGARALVIDDDGMIRAMLTDVLETLGYVVDAVESGEAALARFTAGHYNVVIADWRMPGMSGLDVADELRRIDPAVPVILLTGLGGVEAAEDPRCDGVLVIYKPVSLVNLAAALDTACGRAISA